MPQTLACPGQPAPDRDLRDPELMRRCGVGQPLEIAEHDRRPQPLGQAVDLLVEDLPIGIILTREMALGCPLGDDLVAPAPTSGAPPGACGHAVRDAEEPARDRPAPADGPRPAGQHEEDGLEGVFGVVGVVEDTPADPQHHRAVPDHQLLEGRFRGLVAPREEPVQELRVGHRPDRAEVEQSVHLLKDAVG